jgi:hypothetical protein
LQITLKFSSNQQTDDEDHGNMPFLPDLKLLALFTEEKIQKTKLMFKSSIFLDIKPCSLVKGN